MFTGLLEFQEHFRPIYAKQPNDWGHAAGGGQRNYP